MLKNWQFNTLFFVGVGGAVLLLIGPYFGLESNPTAATGVGAILAYVLAQKKSFTKHEDEKAASKQESSKEASKDDPTD